MTTNLRKAEYRRILAITGAGISADSGIPTFRGAGGYWNNFKTRELATAEGFQTNPQAAWSWYSERRAAIQNAKPNAAHFALVALQNQRADFLLVTQNVDNLDIRAGMPSEKLVQIHGDIFVTKCRRCGFRKQDFDQHVATIPICPECGANLSPGVVWFDEELAVEDVSRIHRFLNVGPCDLVLVIGTTSEFPYIVDWAMQARKQRGLLVEINPKPALSKHADHVLKERAVVALPSLVKDIERYTKRRA